MNELWQQGSARKTALRGDCLSSDLLFRAGLNDLNEAERQQIVEHLIGCADCSEEYRIVRAANDWAKDIGAEHDRQSAQPIRPRPSRWRSFFDLTGFGYPARAVLAAVLLIAAAVSVWTVKLRLENQTLQAKLNQQQEERTLAAARQAIESQQQAEQLLASNQTLATENSRLKEELDLLSNPQIETPIIDVDPASLTRGTAEPGSAVAKIQVPPTASVFTVILHLPGERPERLLLVELVDRKTNSVLWSGQQKRDKSPNLTLTLAKNKYPAGKYRIRISGLNGQSKTLIDHYDIQVSY